MQRSTYMFIIIFMNLFMAIPTELTHAYFPVVSHDDEVISLIIEVEGDPHEQAKYLNTYYPFIEVVEIYDLLFNGVAIQGKSRHVQKLSAVEFIKAIHPVQVYETLSMPANRLSRFDDYLNAVFPADLHATPYTGKGVKVAVIDTGIDYDHPDLQINFKGGYDVVDLDDDPMETTAEEGVVTSHGTHVAGIIAANGILKGVAPDANIYAYRALGPGGQGTSVQVIAAMEIAAKDGVDIMNLSLGNAVNGPDYPTSIAVNRAVDLGIMVVIANGNSGPNNWTVGSPATASKALSVGAVSMPKSIPYLYDAKTDTSIDMTLMIGSRPWHIIKTTNIIDLDQNPESVAGQIALSKRDDVPFYEKVKQAEVSGAVALLVYNDETGLFQGAIMNDDDSVTIPVAAISKEDGEWIQAQLNEGSLYLKTNYRETTLDVAAFSSRGPVTVNWELKPDVVAPGTNILSTVPDGYQMLQGTSMAAPHVAGALALIKEAKPDWSHEQMIGALKTTARPMTDESGQLLEPIMQGLGFIQVSEAINTNTIIYHPSLSFGTMVGRLDRQEAEFMIENMSNKSQSFYFSLPTKHPHDRYMSWRLPRAFKLQPYEKKSFTIELTTRPAFMQEGLYQGWLVLHGPEQTYDLPYLFVNQTADYPRTMGFGFSLKPFSEDTYMYQLYVTEKFKKVSVYLYDQDHLLYEQTLLEIIEPTIGLNEGELSFTSMPKPGLYRAIIIVEKEKGGYISEEIDLLIDPYS